MTPKLIVQKFYESDAIINPITLKKFLHQDVELQWNSSKGFVKLDFQELMNLSVEMSIAYTQSRIKISHLLVEKELVSVRYDHIVATIENPTEEMLLAHFMVIWEIKDEKLFKGFQMSQIL